MIRNLDLEKDSALWHARNIFLFCFNTLGMRVGDAIVMQMKNIQNDRVVYKMGKSDKIKDIGLTAEAKRIVDHYKQNKKPNDYLFPILKTNDKSLYDRIGSATAYLNKLIRIIAEKAEIKKHITTHVARHTWSQMAKLKNINTSVIQEALGHSTMRTTENYLNDFENKVIDDANKLITGD